MSLLDELDLDPDHARRLAAELLRSGEVRTPPPPSLIDGPGLHRFRTAATAAIAASLRRGERAGERACELAESSYSSISAYEFSDAGLAARLGRL
ncbi:hypothetical protein [Corynebacterium halotolerans]|uniref:hypothetical protein n=1 Tax=Corynebacterium halotolerans TaxID=225326 RepID=UPI003CEA87EC